MKNIIKSLRREKNLTQVQLAQILNLDQTAVSKWENGKAIPDTQILIQLADFFDVSTDYLLEKSTLYYPDRIRATDPSLNEEERHILNVYRKLNSINRMKVTSYTEIRLEEQSNGAEARRG